ncbi:MAG: hypothetical protein ACE5JM_08610, partial [Armatimonadota bacterium]
MTSGQWSAKGTHRKARGGACLLLLGAALLAPASVAAQPIELNQIKAIHLPADADAAERQAADVLQKKLGQYYELELEVAEGVPEAGAPAI